MPAISRLLKSLDPVERQVAAYNRRDLDAFLGCYAPDAVVEDAVGTELLRGREAMSRVYRELFGSSPDLHAEITTRLRIGDYVVDEERASGIRGASDTARIVA